MDDQIVKVNDKGQITLPVKMRKLEGIKPNDFVKVSYVPSMIFIDKVEDESDIVEDIMDSFKKLGLTDEDWEEIKKERREADR
ncbi:MAG: AbrB/MazE/SpoVT family DNA-binding domain-containing protein [Candidatus Aenigmarchaeota archaeon]|nr:AbrB/MazE/SpoVT family DNA-binding domain-containing protein [Candidatus Aenigmarchaeota archaeon]